MKANFRVYPNLWGLSKPDPNIDHRRVPNLQTLFRRKGVILPLTNHQADYVAGDIVTWMLPDNLPHIGIIVNSGRRNERKPFVVHNIGSGPVTEDILFEYKITGHDRYYGTRE